MNYSFNYVRDHKYLDENDDSRLSFRVTRVSAPPSPVTSSKRHNSPKATPNKVFYTSLDSLIHSLPHSSIYKGFFEPIIVSVATGQR